jgi:thiamine kinase-like enzyme
LSKVAEAIEQLGRISCPDVPIKRIEQRWADYADESALKLLSGDSLLHTDLSPNNILINESVHVVDWAWPTAGAAWIDPAGLALWLIAEGHTPQEAEAWAQRFPVWTTASDDAIDTFVVTMSSLWAQIAHADPQPWKQQLAAAACRWVRHRSCC